MGAHPYQYLVPFEADAQSALDKLRRQVFEAGDYHGAGSHAGSPDEALELAGDSGTRSILDISRVAEEPDYFCTAALSPDDLMRYFGTEQPSDDQVESCDDLWEELERGKARHVVTFSNGVPTGLFFVGYSFD